MEVVGFTGTRKGLTALQKVGLATTLVAFQPQFVQHGDCVGADAEFHAICQPRFPIDVRPSTLSEQRAFCSGARHVFLPRQPKERNCDLVNTSDVVIACPKSNAEELRSGTWMTIRYARKQNKPLVIIYPDGNVCIEND